MGYIWKHIAAKFRIDFAHISFNLNYFKYRPKNKKKKNTNSADENLITSVIEK